MFESKTKEQIEKGKRKTKTFVDETAMKQVQDKLARTIVETNIRIISSAGRFRARRLSAQILKLRLLSLLKSGGIPSNGWK
jgi:hypothetical protein